MYAIRRYYGSDPLLATEPWTPEEYVRLVVRTAALDASGLALPRERGFGFTTRTPYLRLDSVRNNFV